MLIASHDDAVDDLFDLDAGFRVRGGGAEDVDAGEPAVAFAADDAHARGRGASVGHLHWHVDEELVAVARRVVGYLGALVFEALANFFAQFLPHATGTGRGGDAHLDAGATENDEDLQDGRSVVGDLRAQLHALNRGEQDGSHVDVAVGGVDLTVVARTGFTPDVCIFVAEARQDLDLFDVFFSVLLVASEHRPTSHRALGAHGGAVGVHVVELRRVVHEEALRAGELVFLTGNDVNGQFFL